MVKVKRLLTGLKEQGNEAEKMVGEKREAMERVKYQRQSTALLGLYVKQVNIKLEKLGQIATEFEEVSAKKSAEQKSGGKIYCSGKGIECEEEKTARESVGIVAKEMKRTFGAGCQQVGDNTRQEARRSVENLVDNARPAFLLSLLQDQASESTRQAKRRREVEGFEEEKVKGAVREEMTSLCKEHILVWQKVQHIRSAVAELEIQLDENSKNIIDGGGRITRQRESMSLRGSLVELRKRREELGLASKAGLIWRQKVSEQETQVEQLATVISVLVARLVS